MSEEIEKKIRLLEKENSILKSAASRWDQIQKLYEEANRQLQDVEAELSRAKERLELSLTAGNMACWDWDYKTGQVRIHENRARLLGEDPEEQIKTFDELMRMIHPDDYSKAMGRLDFHLKGEKPLYEAEFRLQTKDGEWKWFLDRGRIVERDILGNPTRISGVLTEMDDLKKSEKDVMQSMAKAEADSQAKSLFLANMSHEIYTPMAGVIGMAQILKQSKLSQEQTEYLDVITKSATNLMAILNDILEYSKIEAGKVEFHEKPFSIHQLIEEISAGYAERAVEKGMEILSFQDPNIPNEVVGDPVRLRQVLKIFMDNALKFTEKGEVRIASEFMEWDDLSVRVRFIIADTGIGISEEGMKRLFLSFSKLDTPEAKKYSGGGLGLAIAKHLIDRMNGKISVESILGEGTTFSIIIDFERYKDSETKDAMKEAIRGLKVMIIDPVTTHAEILRTYFDRWDCYVETIQDPEEALKQIHHQAQIKKPYHLILVEQQLPGMTGLQFATLIKKDNLLLHSKILITTSRLFPLSTSELASAGVLVCLVRPYTLSRLKHRILEAISQTKKGSSRLEEEGEPDPDSADLRKKLLNILLVEDNLINQKVAIVTLEKMGHRIDLAENGKISVEMFSRKHYDLILMDIYMPEMDGLEATMKIREIESSDQTRQPAYICAITANTSREDEEECLRAGMNAYISKPFKLEELTKVINHLY